MKPTLFLLAAGMGSRYGGLKQLDGLGPNGETIMDYSIYDAIKAGFGKLVFVTSTTPSRPDSANSSSLSARTSNRTSARKSSPSMRGTSLANSYSSRSTPCPKASLAPKAVRNPGEQTTPS